MAMTKEDFEVVASAIHNARHVNNAERRLMIHVLSPAFQEINPNFDRNRFERWVMEGKP